MGVGVGCGGGPHLSLRQLRALLDTMNLWQSPGTLSCKAESARVCPTLPTVKEASWDSVAGLLNLVVLGGPEEPEIQSTFPAVDARSPHSRHLIPVASFSLRLLLSLETLGCL